MLERLYLQTFCMDCARNGDHGRNRRAGVHGRLAVWTALLHALGIAAAFAVGSGLRGLVRAAGAACVALGAGLALRMI
ncbi:hypothetical protein BQ8794_110157 [Mesorhizobium prunaredense]|uniref:Uncharacterized protein n=1 Tax=Mesorhizobium prunaredense TaxID=1631249 RepID=A0A1R3V0D5_9HYPH|nr:hypothetical protein BQ8794_110157 [Mesorhizobium prunaredense]